MIRLFNKFLFQKNVINTAKNNGHFNTRSIQTFAEEGAKQNIEIKQKITLMQKWINYWKMLYRDYKNVAIDVSQQIHANPGKSTIKLCVISFLGYAAYVNPDDDSYTNFLIENQLKLILTPQSVRNKSSAQYIDRVETLRSLNLLSYQSFGVCSIIFANDYSESIQLYKKQCQYLQPSYFIYLKEKIIDVGLFNHWYFMNQAMIDYDVNSDEWNEN